MEITIGIEFLIYVSASSICFLAGATVLFYGIKYTPPNQPLGIAFLFLGLLISSTFIYSTRLVIQWPFWYRLPNIFALIFIPMTFLYVVFYSQDRSWKWYDALHAIPMMFFMVDFWDILVMPSTEKVILIQKQLNKSIIEQVPESKFFTYSVHWQLRIILLGLYLLASTVVFLKKRSSNSMFPDSMNHWKKWIFIFLSCLAILWAIHVLMIFCDIYDFINPILVGLCLLLSVSIFFFPTLLYGPKEVRFGGNIGEKVNGKSPMTKVELEKLEGAMHTIESQLIERNLFLRPGYSINDFSRDINMPVYQISKALTMLKGHGFVDYVNQMRIQFCILKLKEGYWMNYTLEAIASECGFTNRNSFTKAFHKFKGESPSKFRRDLKKLNTIGK